ncbi:hypothetical protein [Glutamicibacter sp. AOP5-A2-18]|uniref:hypothetical protein n=1 Tax=Glutamicibacter sp. AOP5-A2-18 TaxID=3457656 RepID=UPI00403358E9
MTKRFVFSMVALTASLALAGCSGGVQSEENGTPGQPSESAKSQSQGAGDGKSLDAKQVETVASTLLKSDQSVQVISNEQMQPQLEAAKDAEMPAGIKPEKCAELNAKYSVTDLTSSVAATSTSSSEEVGKVVQIFSITDEATRANVLNALAFDDLEDCGTVTIEQSGKELKAKRQILPMDVNAERALTMSTVMDAGGGQTLSSVAVQALDGNNFVLITLQTGSVQPAELATEAVKLTDQAFDEIKSVQ